MIAKKQLPR